MRVAGIAISILAFLLCLRAAGQGASLEQRAQAGDAKAQFELGKAYEDGNGVPQDDAKAVEWFRKSAEQGDAQAQNSLGVMYALGRGVLRDREQAVHWYKQAAQQGLTEAFYNIAISYYNGEGVESNLSMSCSWMMLAQRKGDPQAADALKHIEEEMNHRLDRCKWDMAGMYEKGTEIPQDLATAAALYKETAQQDERQSIFAGTARYKMCQLYATGKGVPQDYGQAKEWCRKTNNPFAYVVLARMAENGLGQEKNLKEARDLYRKAAIEGVPDGYMNSARLHMEGGTHQDEKEAYFWYAIAAKRGYTGAGEKLREVVPRLSDKELAQESRVVDNWIKLPVNKRGDELKKH